MLIVTYYAECMICCVNVRLLAHRLDIFGDWLMIAPTQHNMRPPRVRPRIFSINNFSAVYSFSNITTVWRISINNGPLQLNKCFHPMYFCYNTIWVWTPPDIFHSIFHILLIHHTETIRGTGSRWWWADYIETIINRKKYMGGLHQKSKNKVILLLFHCRQI